MYARWSMCKLQPKQGEIQVSLKKNILICVSKMNEHELLMTELVNYPFNV